MKTRTLLVTLGAAGVLAIGALAVPALADPPSNGNGSGYGSGMGAGYGPGYGPGMGAGPPAGLQHQRGACPGVVAPSGTLTQAQQTALAANAEEEKLAHDLYTELAARYDAVIFDRIAAAETAHLDAVRTLMTRYEVTDPTAGLEPGRFATAEVQATYDRLLAQGSTSQQAALEVGRTVETADIDALRAALDGLEAPDVQRVYTHLINASERHLAAFTTWLSR